MKENKDVNIRVRVTQADKDKIYAYCEANGLNTSQFVRLAIQEYLNKKGD